MRAADQQRLLALSGERDRWAAFAAAEFRAGVAWGERTASGFTIGDLRDAYLAGQRAAHADQLPAFDAGVAAAERRFGAEMNGRRHHRRVTELERARWTRHHPDCPPTARACAKLGCLPGPRQDFGKPAPWDRAGVAP